MASLARTPATPPLPQLQPTPSVEAKGQEIKGSFLQMRQAEFYISGFRMKTCAFSEWPICAVFPVLVPNFCNLPFHCITLGPRVHTAGEPTRCPGLYITGRAPPPSFVYADLFSFIPLSIWFTSKSFIAIFSLNISELKNIRVVLGVDF